MVTQTGDTVPVDPSTARRSGRYAAQRLLWNLPVADEDTRLRNRTCGKPSSAEGVQLRVTTSPDGSRHGGYAGLQTCGSVWSCPTCSATILARRSEELAQAMTNWKRDHNGRVAFYTYTVRHDASMTIDQVWDAVSAGQNAITSAGAYADERDRHGVHLDGYVTSCDVRACGRVTVCKVKSCGGSGARAERHALVCQDGQPTAAALRHAPHCRIGRPVRSVLPWVRLVEVTVGASGWHVHQHMLVFLPSTSTDADAGGLYDTWWQRWADGAASAGVDGSEQVNRWRWADEDAASYFTKNTYLTGAERSALEMARGDLKKGRHGNRSTMELLDDVVCSRVPDDVALWQAFELASLGRRNMLWSHGARDVLGLGVEVDDEEIPAEETGTVEDAVADIPGRSYMEMCSVPGRRARLVEAVERSTREALDLLTSWGIPWDVPLSAPPEWTPTSCLVT